MIQYKTIAVVGGDLRQAHIANRLAEQGNRVYALLLENNATLRPELSCPDDPAEVLPECDVVIFPLPLTTDEATVNAPFSQKRVFVKECFDCIRPGAAVFAGKVSPAMQELAAKKEMALADYLKREELAVKNAVITAEGAIAIAMEEMPTALFGSKCLITGHGRISRALMRVLNAMGAQVTVAARKYGDLAWIEAGGCHAIHIASLAEHVGRADLVFNTVPACVLGREILSKLRKDALIIDLASKPGGVEFDTARELGIKTVWALSLPGKCAPISAGDIILETIGNCLAEQGVL